MRLFSFAILFALVLTPLLAEKDKAPVSDDVIVDQVRVRLADDSEVGGQPIQVDAHNGMVVLTGSIVSTKWPKAGQTVRSSIEALGEAVARFV